MSIRTKEDAVSYGMTILYAGIALEAESQGYLSEIGAALLWVSLTAVTTAVLTMHLYYLAPRRVSNDE